jgi:hypothetical protein
MAEQAHNITLGLTRKSLHAIVIHGCPHCEAPGLYKADAYTEQHWPGCFLPAMHNRPVGDVCPNCRKPRRADRNLGELCASMPLWLWTAALAFKWCLVKGMILFNRA